MIVKVAVVAALLLVLLLVLPSVLKGLRKATTTVVDNRAEIRDRAKELGATVKDQASTGAGRAREGLQSAAEQGRTHGEAAWTKGRESAESAWERSREGRTAAWERGRTGFESARGKAGDLAGTAAAKAGLRTKGHGVYARTLLIGAPATRSLPFVEAGIARAGLLDEVAVRAGETQAWAYDGTGRARLALVDDGRGRSVLGVTDFEYVWGEPQGGPAVDAALDRAEQALVEASLAVGTQTRTFTPGEDDSSDGMRTAPLL